MPVFGDPAERFLAQLKEAIKAGLHGGMLFEDLGFRYIGPIDGHNIALLRKYLQMVKKLNDPVLLHVVTEKGHGFQPAAEDDPAFFHTPPAFVEEDGKAVPKSRAAAESYTRLRARRHCSTQMRRDPRVAVHDRRHVPGQQAGAGPRRVSRPLLRHRHLRIARRGLCRRAGQGGLAADRRHLQHVPAASYDQIFQEVALQNLPVAFTLDRAGLTGPDGPTHHGVFDLAYMRAFPNMVVMAPGDAHDVPADARLRPAARRALRDPLSQSIRRHHRAQRRSRWSWAGPKCCAGATTASFSAAARCCTTACRPPTRCANRAWMSAWSTPGSSSRSIETSIRRAVDRMLRSCVTVEEGTLDGRIRQRRAGGRQRPGTRYRPRAPTRDSRSVHRARRTGRTAGRPAARRARHRPRLPRIGRPTADSADCGPLGELSDAATKRVSHERSGRIRGR